MATFSSRLLNLARKIDDQIDGLQQRLTTNPFQFITSFRTYGTASELYVKGRVLSGKEIGQGNLTDRGLTNLWNMVRRFETDEVPNAIINLLAKGTQTTVSTDKEGFFEIRIPTPTPFILQNGFLEIPLTLSNSLGENLDSELAEVLIPAQDAEYGVISDIDDTIVFTGVTDIFEMAQQVFFENAQTRTAFPGVSEFYNALVLGQRKDPKNPIFYVSSSPWNLYDIWVDFMNIRQIPAGPILLRDFGLQSDSFVKHDYLGHKFKEISQILQTYPHLNFVLLGDSGEKDPSIYLEVVKGFPGRISCIYIRNVGDLAKQEATLEIAKQSSSLGVEMLLISHTDQAADHARSIGLIQ